MNQFLDNNIWHTTDCCPFATSKWSGWTEEAYVDGMHSNFGHRCQHSTTKFWDKIIMTTNYIVNCCNTWAIRQSTPYQWLLNKKTSFSHLHFVGCVAYVHIAKELWNKLRFKVLNTMFLGYNNSTKSYHYYESTSIFLSFLENRCVVWRDSSWKFQELGHANHGPQLLKSVSCIWRRGQHSLWLFSSIHHHRLSLCRSYWTSWHPFRYS